MNSSAAQVAAPTKQNKCRPTPSDDVIAIFSTVEATKEWISFEPLLGGDVGGNTVSLDEFYAFFGEKMIQRLSGGKFTDPDSIFPRQSRIERIIDYLTTKKTCTETTAQWRNKTNTSYYYNPGTDPVLSEDRLFNHPTGLSHKFNKSAAAAWVLAHPADIKPFTSPHVSPAEYLYSQLVASHLMNGDILRHNGRDKTYFEMSTKYSLYPSKAFCDAFVEICPVCRDAREKFRAAHAKRAPPDPTIPKEARRAPKAPAAPIIGRENGKKRPASAVSSDKDASASSSKRPHFGGPLVALASSNPMSMDSFYPKLKAAPWALPAVQASVPLNDNLQSVDIGPSLELTEDQIHLLSSYLSPPDQPDPTSYQDDEITSFVGLTSDAINSAEWNEARESFIWPGPYDTASQVFKNSEPQSQVLSSVQQEGLAAIDSLFNDSLFHNSEEFVELDLIDPFSY